MSTAILGACYLFSILQSILVDQPLQLRLCLSPLVHASLQDWVTLAHSLTTHPVPIASLVPRAPHYVGAVDASLQGIGRFWLPTHHGHLTHSIAFCIPFPQHLANTNVSASKKFGSTTNSNFELAALVAGMHVLALHMDTPYANVWCGSDNTSAVS